MLNLPALEPAFSDIQRVFADIARRVVQSASPLDDKLLGNTQEGHEQKS